MNFYLGVDEDIRGACCRAVAALIARVGDADFPRRQLIRETEKSAVWAGVSAEAFLPEETDGQESANCEKGNSNRDRRKSRPKITRDEMIGEFWDKRSGLRAEKISIRGGPNKHVEGSEEWNVDQKPRPKRPWIDSHLLQEPATEILQGENVTTPAADETAENQRRQDRQSKEDESGVNRPAL